MNTISICIIGSIILMLIGIIPTDAYPLVMVFQHSLLCIGFISIIISAFINLKLKLNREFIVSILVIFLTCMVWNKFYFENNRKCAAMDQHIKSTMLHTEVLTYVQYVEVMHRLRPVYNRVIFIAAATGDCSSQYEFDKSIPVIDVKGMTVDDIIHIHSRNIWNYRPPVKQQELMRYRYE